MRTAPTSNVNVERAENWFPPSSVAIHRFIGACVAHPLSHHSLFSFKILRTFRATEDLEHITLAEAQGFTLQA
jgi:hypothetical protein